MFVFYLPLGNFVALLQVVNRYTAIFLFRFLIHFSCTYLTLYDIVIGLHKIFIYNVVQWCWVNFQCRGVLQFC